MSFYAGMSEDEKIVFTMVLIQTIAKYISPRFMEYSDDTKLSEVLGSMIDNDKMVFEDPVISKLLLHIECYSDHAMEFSHRMSIMAAMSLDQHLSNQPGIGRGERNLIDIISCHGVEGLSQFVLVVCDTTLEDIIQKTQRSLNHIPAVNEGALYSVDIFYSRMVSGKNNYADFYCLDVLTSFSAELLSKNIRSSIKYILETRLLNDPDHLVGALIDTVILRELTVRSNEDVMCTIPLMHDGHSQGKDMGSYSLDYRMALHAKGVSAYNLDFDRIKVNKGASKELLDLATHFPSGAARRLRGAALEDSLGL
jgi:hypothetical protein